MLVPWLGIQGYLSAAPSTLLTLCTSVELWAAYIFDEKMGLGKFGDMSIKSQLVFLELCHLIPISMISEPTWQTFNTMRPYRLDGSVLDIFPIWMPVPYSSAQHIQSGLQWGIVTKAFG